MITYLDLLEVWPDNQHLATAVNTLFTDQWRGARFYLPKGGGAKQTHKTYLGVNVRFTQELQALCAQHGGDIVPFLRQYGGGEITI